VEWTDAALLALVACEVAVAGGDTTGVLSSAERLAPLAARFGRSPASARLAAVWAARAHRGDPRGAGEECARGGGEPALASALAGLGVPVPPSPAAAEARTLIEAIPPRRSG
jgi:hypothetical protein